MEEENKELIKKYQAELKSMQEDFQPCISCCDLTNLRTVEYEIKRFLIALDSII
jgi:hypothetical protein